MDKNEFKYLVDKMERKKNSIKNTIRDWDTYPVERRPNIYGMLALDAETVAIHSLLLGNKVEALKWFKESSEYSCLTAESYRSQSGPCSYEGEMGRCKDALNMAILSGDKQLIDRSVQVSLSICEQFPVKFPMSGLFYYYLTAFAYFLVGKRELAESVLDKMPTDNKQFGRLLVGLKESLRGLIYGDKSGLISGLNVLLEWHGRHCDSRMPYDLISIDGTVLIKIARERGIIVMPGDIEKGNGKYIPWNLFE